MGPLTAAGLVSGGVALCSDVITSVCTFKFMGRKKKDKLEDFINKRGPHERDNQKG